MGHLNLENGGTPHFKFEEFNCSGKYIPVQVRAKIYTNFMLPLEIVRARVGRSIFISQKSGFRSSSWEHAHGRYYISEHQYRARGAADLVLFDGLVTALFESGLFPRIIVYRHRGFCHVDYKFLNFYKVAVYEMAEDEQSMRLVLSVKK